MSYRYNSNIQRFGACLRNPVLLTLQKNKPMLDHKTLKVRRLMRRGIQALIVGGIFVMTLTTINH